MRPNLYDYLKILALITMIIDHVGYFLYPDLEVLRVIGRLAFPLFLFLVGRNHSYGWRNSLWLRGILLQIAMWAGVWRGTSDVLALNILLAIGITRVVLSRIKVQQSSFLEWILFALAIIYASSTQDIVDYGTLNILFALVGYRSRKYGFGWLTGGLVCGSVLYHLLFMKEYRGFGTERDLAFLFIGILLISSMLWMTIKNSSLKIHQMIDKIIVSISSHALELYVFHACLLVLISSFSI